MSCQVEVVKDYHLWNGESWAPLFLEYVQADISIVVDIRMEDLGSKSDLQWLQQLKMIMFTQEDDKGLILFDESLSTFGGLKG